MSRRLPAWSVTFLVGQGGRFLEMFTHLVFRLKFELVKSAMARRTRGTFSPVCLDSGRAGSEEQTSASDQLAAGGQ